MKIIWTKILKFLNFLILKNFSRILKKFHFSISISRQFHFTFHSRSRFWGIFISLFTLDLDIKAFSFHFSFSKWVNQIFISLFTSRNEWTRFPFHFSLLELPISTLAGPCTVDNECPTATPMDSLVLAQKAFPVKRDLFKTEEKSDDEKDVAIHWVWKWKLLRLLNLNLTLKIRQSRAKSAQR